MSYDAECYCADNDGVPCVFCEMETNTRLRLLARNIRDAAVGYWCVSKGLLMSMQSALGLPLTWEPGHALKGAS